MHVGNALAAVGWRPGKWDLSCDLGFTLLDTSSVVNRRNLACCILSAVVKQVWAVCAHQPQASASLAAVKDVRCLWM